MVSLWLRRDSLRAILKEYRPEPEVGRCKQRLSSSVTLFLEWVHQVGQSLMHITVGLPGTQGQEPAETLLWVGWSIFVLLTLTAYTANLAAFLIEAPRPSSYIVSLEHADASNSRICLYDSLVGEVRTMFPEIKSTTLFEIPSSVLGAGGALERYYVENGCEGLIQSINEVRRDFDIASTICTLGLFAARHIMEIPLAFPVSKDLAGPLSYWVQQLNSEFDFAIRFDPPTYQRCSDIKLGRLSWPDRQPIGASEGPASRRQLAGGKSKSKGGAAGAGATEGKPDSCAGACADEDKIWTEVGLVQGEEEGLEKLTVGNLSAAIIVWAFCLALAIPLSIYHQKARVYDPPPPAHVYSRRRSKGKSAMALARSSTRGLAMPVRVVARPALSRSRTATATRWREAAAAAAAAAVAAVDQESTGVHGDAGGDDEDLRVE